MKKINYFILSLVVLLSLGSCDNVDFGDMNDNTNGATEGNPSSLLAGAIMNYSTVTNRTYLTIPTLYVQYQSQVSYTTEMRYSDTPISWSGYYIQTLSNLNEVININLDPDSQGATLNAQGAPENQIGVAKIMMAVIAKRVTDNYGPIPYSQAFQGLDNLTPAYDKQEDLYKNLISQVKEARDMMDAGAKGPTGDILLNGNIAKWQSFANSLILQMSLQLSNKYPSESGYAATEFNAALSDSHGVIENVADEPWFQYQNLEGFRNPWFANRTPDYFLSKEFTDALNGKEELNPTSNSTYDSRLKVYGKSGTSDGVPYGYADGSGAGKNQMSTKNYWNATSPLPVMTASYTYLNRAEAAELGWTSEDATEMLRMGIEKSYETLDYHHSTSITDDAAAYADARIADAATVGMLQVIREEKWVSLFGQAFDAWSEWRRTDVPNLIPATDYLNSGEIPTRMRYPSEESSLNNANYTEAVSWLVPAQDTNTSLIWWDQAN